MASKIRQKIIDKNDLIYEPNIVSFKEIHIKFTMRNHLMFIKIIYKDVSQIENYQNLAK